MKKVHIPWARAGAEFIAILAGVTVALLADDWRQYRNDREEEQVALQEIHNDLAADSVALNKMRQLAQAQTEAAFWAQENFERDLPADSALQGIEPLGFLELYQPPKSGYVGLRDSGRLALVLNGDLRRRIVTYYESTQTYIQQLETLYHPRLKEYLDNRMEDILLVLHDSAGRLGSQDGFHQTLRRPWRQISSEFEFQTETTYLGLLASNFGYRVDEAMKENQQLRVAITQELGT
ncbi:MAG: hypothetical protein PVJ76_17800 [Gemmatimonadota bacterium]